MEKLGKAKVVESAKILYKPIMNEWADNIRGKKSKVRTSGLLKGEYVNLYVELITALGEFDKSFYIPFMLFFNLYKNKPDIETEEADDVKEICERLTEIHPKIKKTLRGILEARIPKNLKVAVQELNSFSRSGVVVEFNQMVLDLCEDYKDKAKDGLEGSLKRYVKNTANIVSSLE